MGHTWDTLHCTWRGCPVDTWDLEIIGTDSSSYQPIIGVHPFERDTDRGHIFVCHIRIDVGVLLHGGTIVKCCPNMLHFSIRTNKQPQQGVAPLRATSGARVNADVRL